MSSLLEQVEHEFLVKEFIKQMVEGMTNPGKKALKCLQTHITSLPTGNERGSFLAVDLGGTNIRVGHICLLGDGKWRVEHLYSTRLPLDEMVSWTTGVQVFDYVAQLTWDYVVKSRDHPEHIFNDHPKEGSTAMITILLGMTFSYPVKQKSINQGILLRWNKAIPVKCNDVIGQDVVKLFQESLDRLRPKSLVDLYAIKITSLINDTTATLVANWYSCKSRERTTSLSTCDRVHPERRIAVVLGTGTNACFWSSNASQLINTEWGSFGEPNEEEEDKRMEGNEIESVKANLLRLKQAMKWSKWDELLDQNYTPNPGRQPFEKMVAGQYIGTLVSIISSNMNVNFNQSEAKQPQLIDKSKLLSTEQCSQAEEHVVKIKEVKNSFLQNEFQMTDEIGKVARAVTDRSIDLLSTLVIALCEYILEYEEKDPESLNCQIEKNNSRSCCECSFNIIIDGSMFTKYFDYAPRLQKSIDSKLSKTKINLPHKKPLSIVICIESAQSQSSIGSVAVIKGTQVIKC